MKDAVFILLVILVVFAMTAARYRRQISTLIQMWRMLKGASQRSPKEESASGELGDRALPLVNCSKCSRWVSENEAIRVGTGNYFCSRECFERSVNLR